MEIGLEPYLIKAISLLHSKAKDSGDQLKSMLDDAIRQRNENQSLHSKLPPPLTNIIKKDNKKKCDILNEEDVPLSKRRKESPRTSRPSSPTTSSIEKKSESRRKCEIFSEEESSPAKRIKDSPSSSQPSSPMSRSPQQSGSFSPLPGSVRKSEDSNSLLDADDLAQEIMDLHCVICNGLDVSPGNQLVECQECHGLYHQECHHPPISDAEVNDPRLVWYCSSCSKTMKKTTGKPKPNRESPITFKSRSDSPSIGGSTKSSHPTNFKSTTSKTNTKSASSSSSSTSSPSSSSNVTSSLISADKRLQIIKKRAASKLQEKRKPTK